MNIQTTQKNNERYAGVKGLWAEKYGDILYKDLYLSRNEYILNFCKAIKNSSQKRCLDFGCGQGDVVFLLAPIFSEVYGVDVVPQMIKCANENAAYLNLRNTIFFTAENEKLPYEDNFFDCIVSPDVFEHIHPVDRLVYLKELIRILKDDGKILIITPDKKIISFLELVDNFFLKIISRPQASVKNNDMNYFLTKDEAVDFFNQTNVNIEIFERICFYPAPERVGFFGYVEKLFKLLKLNILFSFSFRIVFNIFNKLKFLNQKMVFVLIKKNNTSI